MAKDPVCGMTVDEARAAASFTYEGKTYYFCSSACKAQFEKDPVKYLGQGTTHASHHGHCCCH